MGRPIKYNIHFFCAMYIAFYSLIKRATRIIASNEFIVGPGPGGEMTCWLGALIRDLGSWTRPGDTWTARHLPLAPSHHFKPLDLGATRKLHVTSLLPLGPWFEV
jgi:hypothetical protein